MQQLHKLLALAIICAAVRAQDCPRACSCITTRLACDSAAAPQDRLPIDYFQTTYGKQLQNISWTNSKLNTVEINVFNGLEVLEYIDLSRNEIGRIERGPFGGLSRLKSLNLSRNFIKHISRNTFTGLENLEVLDMSYNLLHGTLPFQVFGVMNKLQYLDISHNHIVSFIQNFFNLNRHLKALFLNNNKISHISYTAVDLKELETLDISSNELEYIHMSTFDKFEQLRELNLSFNQFQNIPQDVYNNLKNLRWLSMGGNRLRKLPPKLFQFNENLKTIYLDHTELEVIQNNNFIGLDSLQQLFIRNNEFLREIETFVFEDTPTITHLDLSSNALVSLPNSLTKLNNLQELRLANNPWACDCRMKWFAGWADQRKDIIKSDLTCAFSYPNDMIGVLKHTNCTSIISTTVRAQDCPPACSCNSTHLVCDTAAAPLDRLPIDYFQRTYGKLLLDISWTNSKLSTLEIDVFKGLEVLEYIDLSRNEIRSIERGLFGGLHRLKSLNLSRNFIWDIPMYSFADLVNLETLDVSHNQLHINLYTVFRPLIKLQYLDISHNQLASFHYYHFDSNLKLKALFLNNNSAVEITSYAIANLKKLEILDISSNKLKNIPKSIFDKFEQLRELNLSFNQFQNISQDVYKNLKNLRWLSMGGNRLRTLPPLLFQHNENLKTIYLDHTELDVIQNTIFKSLSTLQQLYIRNNEFLREIETFVFEDTPAITHLDLSSNALVSLPNSLTKLNNLQELRLANNPWVCDCRMKWFADWADKRKDIIKSDLTCAFSYPNDMIRVLKHTNCTPIISATVRAQDCPPACSCNSTHLVCDTAAAPLDRLPIDYFQTTYGKLLEDISWTNSKLNTLEIGVFDGLEVLEYIDLSRNEIRRTERGLFGGLSRLKSLNLSRNFIEDISMYSFADLVNLETLDVSHNRLHINLYTVFRPLIKLQYLDISHNQIASFLHYHFDSNLKLKTLFLNNNSAVEITSNALANLTKLEILDISSNKLKYIPKSIFDKFEQLRKLNLSFNQFQNISQDVYKNLKNLRWLSMGGNRLRTLPPLLFRHNENLKTIYLDHTELDVIQNTIFKSLSTLQQLYIRNNEFLREIETFVFEDTPAITHLDLSSNALVSLPNSLTKLNNLQELRLANNPWVCDCRMKWFADWADKRKDIIKSDLTCAFSYPNDMIRVLKHTNCEPPTLISSRSQTLYRLQKDALLDCKFAGNPMPSITWITPSKTVFHWNPDPLVQDIFHKHGVAHDQYYNAIDISESRVRVLDDGTLFIRNVHRDDCGTYLCLATNPSANLTAEVVLNIDPITMFETKYLRRRLLRKYTARVLHALHDLQIPSDGDVLQLLNIDEPLRAALATDIQHTGQHRTIRSSSPSHQ